MITVRISKTSSYHHKIRSLHLLSRISLLNLFNNSSTTIILRKAATTAILSIKLKDPINPAGIKYQHLTSAAAMTNFSLMKSTVKNIQTNKYSKLGNLPPLRNSTLMTVHLNLHSYKNVLPSNKLTTTVQTF